MPQFAPGEAKTAIAPITAKPAGMSCQAELFLGPDELTKIATSGKIPFVSTGASQSVSLPITMPSEPGTYHGYIDVFAGGLRFLAYKTTEDVVIAEPAAAKFYMPAEMTVRVTHFHLTIYWKCAFSVVITNNGNATGTFVLNGIDSLDRTWAARQITLAPGQTYTWSIWYYIDFKRMGDYIWELFGDWDQDNYSRGVASSSISVPR